jgi:hypothetical protein
MVRDGVPNEAPDVDDPHAALEQTIGVFRNSAAHPSQGRGMRLIDVHAHLDGSSNQQLALGEGISKLKVSHHRIIVPRIIARLAFLDRTPDKS